MNQFLRKYSYDRYLASLFSPAKVRPQMLALLCIQAEFERVCMSCSQSATAMIRLKWWQDEHHRDAPYANDDMQGESEDISPHALLSALPRDLDGVDATDFIGDMAAAYGDFISTKASGEATFEDMAACEQFSSATYAAPLMLQAHMLGLAPMTVGMEAARKKEDEQSREEKAQYDLLMMLEHLGISYGMASAIYHAELWRSREVIIIPADLMAKYDIRTDIADEADDEQRDKYENAIEEMAAQAQYHLDKARDYAYQLPRSTRRNAAPLMVTGEIVRRFIRHKNTAGGDIRLTFPPTSLLKMGLNALLARI